jgi:hypothetical protein
MSLWQVSALVMALVSWLNATPTSLADAAEREALRRHFAPKSTQAFSLSEFQMAQAAAEPPVAAEAPPTDPVAGADGAKKAEPGKDAPKTAPKQDEQWWRDRMKDARAAVDHDQILADAVQNKINSLAADFVNRDDPAQRAQLADQRQKAEGELARLKKQIEADQKAIDAIQLDARRQSIPPGWIR